MGSGERSRRQRYMQNRQKKEKKDRPSQVHIGNNCKGGPIAFIRRYPGALIPVAAVFLVTGILLWTQYFGGMRWFGVAMTIIGAGILISAVAGNIIVRQRIMNSQAQASAVPAQTSVAMTVNQPPHHVTVQTTAGTSVSAVGPIITIHHCQSSTAQTGPQYPVYPTVVHQSANMNSVQQTPRAFPNPPPPSINIEPPRASASPSESNDANTNDGDKQAGAAPSVGCERHANVGPPPSYESVMYYV
ncbi:uncharacterized protein [Ptychodera flava]|uniref:uncharacterized protein n=1 Tax=Ptychodera flava TaxID=63121 RepID=UPI00396A354E